MMPAPVEDPVTYAPVPARDSLAGVDAALAGVEEAVDALRQGRPVLLLDDVGPHLEGDLVFAAAAATGELLAFVVRHTSGFVQVAVTGSRAAHLDLAPTAPAGISTIGTGYLTSVDAADVGTGISAGDRARTIALLGDAATGPDALIRPGHVVAHRAHEEGVLGRVAREEAAHDLVRLSGLGVAAAYAGLVSERDPTRMARIAELVDFAAEHGLPIVSASSVVAHRLQLGEAGLGRGATRTDEVVLHGRRFRLVTWANGLDQTLALVLGHATGTPVHVHDECLHALFDPQGCSCRREVAEAVRSIATAGHGLLIYRRPRRPAAAGGHHPASAGPHDRTTGADVTPSPFGP
jgi:3,4-dihydroxy 2-butanone 4-phosphate synthase/GTP cyclohydrolase II